MTWRKIAALGLLCLFGASVLPLQSRLQREAEAAHFHKTTLTINLRERIGQAGFLAALSGFRSPLAALLWIEAHTAWENTEWGRMAGLLRQSRRFNPAH